MSLHRARTHPTFVEGCWACQVSTVHLAADSPEVAVTDLRERALGKDRDAYKRLRKSGTQPPQINGSAHLEATCTDKMEVAMAKPARTTKELKLIREGVERSNQLGLIPHTGPFSADGQ